MPLFSRKYSSMPYRDSEMMTFQEGDLVVARFPEDRKWYRARVFHVLEGEYSVSKHSLVLTSALLLLAAVMCDQCAWQCMLCFLVHSIIRSYRLMVVQTCQAVSCPCRPGPLFGVEWGKHFALYWRDMNGMRIDVHCMLVSQNLTAKIPLWRTRCFVNPPEWVIHHFSSFTKLTYRFRYVTLISGTRQKCKLKIYVNCFHHSWSSDRKLWKSSWQMLNWMEVLWKMITWDCNPRKIVGTFLLFLIPLALHQRSPFRFSCFLPSAWR